MVICAQCGKDITDLDKNTLYMPVVVILSDQTIVHFKCLRRYKAAHASEPMFAKVAWR